MDKDSIIDDLINQFKTETSFDVMSYLQEKYKPWEKGEITNDVIVKLIEFMVKKKLILQQGKSFLYEIGSFGNDILDTYKGWLKYLDKIKIDKDASNKKSKLELLKIKTDIFKNLISISIFIVSLFLNGLYIFGIITFNFSSSDKNLKVVKDKMQTIQVKKNDPQSKMDKKQSDSIRLNMPKQMK